MTMKRRLAVYFHYDAAGQIDTACRIAVEALCRYTEKIWFVTNGTLNPAARAWVVQTGAALLERENTGYDAGAYRDALFAIGRDKVAEYEELLLLNYTLAGPVCPLETMFAAMDNRDVDFWGLTRHYAMQSGRFGGQVPEHLQSHFIAVRPSLFCTDAFWQYWQEMPMPQSYEQAVQYHELRFTKTFAGAGYRWDTYVDTADLAAVFVNPIMACPRALVAKRSLPFFKRRSFFTPYADELRRTDGCAARELYDYLKANTEYPVDLLVGALLRSQPLSALAQNLHWHRVLPGVTAHTAPAIDLPAEGLELLRFAWPSTGDTVTDYYTRKAEQEADALLPQVVELFRRDPMLGLAGPALPLWPGAEQQTARLWRQAYPTLKEKMPTLPMSPDCPPPVPCSGWVLVRSAAYWSKIPAQTEPADAWLLPLMAQQNGYTCMTFETQATAAARADMLRANFAAARSPATVAKQLARLAKKQLKGDGTH